MICRGDVAQAANEGLIRIFLAAAVRNPIDDKASPPPNVKISSLSNESFNSIFEEPTTPPADIAQDSNL
ncbi:hypothetical protein TNIN_493261 [Trichonephila inaurata madagascariensis]|uniref:Uncharacterized protein n=1 Tax=Trichonephila inaurata madagascariensis TaxID=2747483 RepID=A0A8X7CP00_9ARAC|nr:hypothetical protein TNIN_493261 [Trichonephila inaurata madagascariensis]